MNNAEGEGMTLPIPKARESGTEAMDLLQSLAADLVREHPEAAIEVTRTFFTTVREAIDVLMPRVQPPANMLAVRAMDDEEARKFEAETMTFGKYAGTPIGNVPPDYLLYLDENQFAAKLRRYVASERFKRLQ